jgi:sulfate-transporting ATPase
LTTFIQFALLGLGIGAIYSLLAQGVVLIYRGAGIVSFCHGAVAMVGAFTYYELRVQLGQATWVAVVGAVLLSALLGAVIQLLIMRPLERASSLVRLVATLAILIVLQSAALLRYSATNYQIPQLLPHSLVRIGSVSIPQDRLWLTSIAIALTAALWAVGRFTLLGLATTAVQENQRAVALLGWSPNVIAVANWSVGCALAGLAGVLIVPITGLQVTTLTLTVVGALAAALAGGFRSFWLTLIAGMAIGVANSVISNYVQTPGWADAAPVLVIMLILIVRGRALPLRDYVLERLPRVGTGRIRVGWAAAGIIVLGLCVWQVFPDNYVVAIATLATGALFLLSIVVLTGYAGQLSLGQYVFGGTAALVAGRLIDAAGWPQWAAILAGLAAVVPASLLFAVPALRTRGVNLAVLTLGLGDAAYQVVFSGTKYTGGTSGTTVGPLHLFGIDFDPFLDPKAYTGLTLGCFVVCALMVANIRRGRVGRRLLAVRSNERAAASLGISVVGAKLYAFVVSAVLAGLAGLLLAFSNYSVVYTIFDPLSSVNVVSLAVIGGVGYLLGPVAGGVLVTGAVATVVGQDLFGQGFANWLALIGGVLLILTLIAQPDGVVPEVGRQLKLVLRLVGRRREAAVPAGPSTAAADAAIHAHRVRPAALSVSDLSVRFGAVQAVDGVSLEVRPGQVVGLIGPNGAGKTTLIDAVCGMVPSSSGRVRIGDHDVTDLPPYRRVRAGLGRSFQSLELFEDLTIRENLRAAYEPRDRLAYLENLLRAGRDPAPPAAAAAVEIFRLGADLDRLPNELPAGRRRLVAIARAVAAEPSVLLLDEPAAGLDEGESTELAQLIRRLADDWAIAVLLVEHDVDLIMSTCDKLIVLDFGHPIAEGTPAEVRSSQAVIDAYLGIATSEDADTEDDVPGAVPDAVTETERTR